MIIIEGREVFSTLEELVKPEYTALLLIDVQNDFCSPGGCFDKIGKDMSMLKKVVLMLKVVVLISTILLAILSTVYVLDLITAENLKEVVMKVEKQVSM